MTSRRHRVEPRSQDPGGFKHRRARSSLSRHFVSFNYTFIRLSISPSFQYYIMEFDKSRRRKTFSITNGSITFLLLLLAAASPVHALQPAVGQAPILPYLPSIDLGPSDTASSQPQSHKFTLRHVFHRGTHLYPDLRRRLDVHPTHTDRAAATEEGEDIDNAVGPYPVQSSRLTIQRLSNRRIADVEPLLSAARLHGSPPALPASAWTFDNVPGPNATDRDTVINFALMAANAYDKNTDDAEWEDAGAPFNLSESFGWEGDGLRGHIFADETNSTIVLSIKGTSPAVFDGAETTTNDKENDNLFFSCCCGQGGQYLWLKVCDCMSSAYTCNQTCVTKALKKENRYYYASMELYGNVTELYPNANVWLTGHSLGGSVVSLLGLTFGLPVITFQAPGDALPASRLGLPAPPGYNPNYHQTRQYTGAYHFGHTADPIFMGTCNSATSACTLGFYAMQSQCHTGHRCVWDVVEDKKWRVSVTTHKIRAAIKDVYRAYDTLPTCELDTECQDCALWKYFHSNGSETTTSRSSSTSTMASRTRTETCKTPGWWGCLDESTTTSTPTTTSTLTTTLTTTTCTSYGWFGQCLDPITTTATLTTPLPPMSATPTSSTDEGQHQTATSTCHTPGFFYGCKDRTTEAPRGHAITAAPSPRWSIG